ncbi:FadR/GntR family transcriptional regulator [Mesorhizobium sp.]|uniref:FadR/GntR family transcriptional regulator n=1 Tax=Mesorhizobium sp. TaxID=1871066 RepID=UPI000FE53EDB|nr:FadR/GntR family transcriptional regulator [Mesorhizobium sp.]RWD79150.1 MAG: FadR family transcriptional regulator [Mesorhizobium sp.]
MSATQKTKLSQKLYETLRQRVESGEWSQGTRIPTEMELASQHAVSRPVVREALVRLRDDGVISSKRGSGSYVLNGGNAGPRKFREIENVADVIHAFEFRLSVECDAAALAAVRRGEADLQALYAAHEAFGQGVDDDGFGDLDFSFHLAVAQASHNPMYSTTMSMLHRQIVFGMRLIGQFSSSGSRTRLDLVESEHTLIIEAIATQNEQHAYDAMFEHLSNSRRRLLGFDAVPDWNRHQPISPG